MHHHYLVHKPYGFLSQFKADPSSKSRLLGELYDFPEGSMAIGRLDKDSEGLLIITTDGQFSEAMRSKSVEKEYVVQLDGSITKKACIELAKGVEIGVEGQLIKTQPCTVRQIEAPNFPERPKRIRSDLHGPTSWVSITITEGKFRQIRKMTAKVGFPTLRLIRVRIGQYSLGEFNPGLVKEIVI